MPSTPSQEDHSNRYSLSVVPPEIATHIFCRLSSFSEVFALSAVCRRLRNLWLENADSIYKQIAPRSIACEDAARRFLVDQGGPRLGSPISAKDIDGVVRNAGVIEGAILQFEREVVSRVNSKLDFELFLPCA